MWYSAIGFVWTIIIGLLCSYLARLICDNQNAELDPDLFFPFVARYIKKRRRRLTEINGNLTSKSLYVFDSKFRDSQRSKEENSYI